MGSHCGQERECCEPPSRQWWRPPSRAGTGFRLFPRFSSPFSRSGFFLSFVSAYHVTARRRECVTGQHTLRRLPQWCAEPGILNSLVMLRI
ncbi:uncharacterized protein CYBJADRAFT_47688 [Cyberlindnera jadinii NRRL Y-1542]|uniref:Uncharacterized protein n=1 Tax=Cyberlindnera jadinii (strain ATCC 18201 / CBS 1600 / BCRC 20928 / JCM 3617 / NBRC 0987 / NRRL Y-1542) TaxID=983966 RepID=A0A1E4S7T1_CYBJN|nr:hypothetical protein CYBJADRAFT_47688 [Cyberlindnera jadinii NRRL Y-1542]ODV75442.1 hypothetical protein CYBJADRAFT_47688 [Cyberlindnera jadinii NRRL Y-1542]